MVKRTLASLDGRALVIGVDRLDYSKGLKRRMEAFGTFLERSPQAARARVTILQVTPKSRSEVPEYARMQRELEEEAGRINGKHGDVDWTPLRYINKSLGHSMLAGLYRMSHIGLVTPLRDGMNLVAKEYVAAQAPDNPGVLVLSQFAGAAEELKSALIINPYDIEATADALARALAMPLDERKDRWRAMMAVLRANSVHDWASHFLEALATNEGENSDSQIAETNVTGAVGVARPESSAVTPWLQRLARTKAQVTIQCAPSAMPRASSERRFTNRPMQPLSKTPKQRVPPQRRTGARFRARARTAWQNAAVEGAIFGETADLLSGLYNWRDS